MLILWLTSINLEASYNVNVEPKFVYSAWDIINWQDLTQRGCNIGRKLFLENYRNKNVFVDWPSVEVGYKDILVLKNVNYWSRKNLEQLSLKKLSVNVVFTTSLMSEMNIWDLEPTKILKNTKNRYRNDCLWGLEHKI